MICHPARIINTQDATKWQISLKDLHQRILRIVRYRLGSFTIAESGQLVRPGDYILYGTYGREPIRDIQQVRDSDGNLEYKETIVKDIRLQRILIYATGETHAILNELLVPYGNFSLRYILYHLHQYFSQSISMEAYCGQHDFDERTFEGWIEWMKQNITILTQLGLTQDRKDNRQTLKQWTEELIVHFYEAGEKALYLLRLALYQQHRMSDHKKRQRKERPG